MKYQFFETEEMAPLHVQMPKHNLQYFIYFSDYNSNFFQLP